nr:MAG TPA: hypothetical protein [Caudoviricetes sp.]
MPPRPAGVPLPGQTERKIGNREKAKPTFPERKRALEIFLYSWVRMKKGGMRA